MQLSRDLVEHIAAPMNSIRSMGLLTRTCRCFREHIRNNEKLWVDAARFVIGCWPPPVTKQPHADDWRYMVKLRVCPWLSKCQNIPIKVYNQIERMGSMCHVVEALTMSPNGKNLVVNITVEQGPVHPQEHVFRMCFYKPRPFRKMKQLITADQTEAACPVVVSDAPEMLKAIRALVIAKDGDDPNIDWTQCSVRRVHKSAYALIDPEYYSLEFFVQTPGGALRFARYLGGHEIVHGGGVLFKSGEFWLAANGLLHYVGPREDQKLVDDKSDAEGAEEGSSESDASDGGVDVEPVRIFL